MPISQTDQLISLVQTLTKSEKRNFRLYAKRIQDSDSLMYLRLFDIMDSKPELTDQMIIKRMGDITKSQYSNLKRHLYNQILVSLRLIHRRRKTAILIHEYLDFADVLYGKGLYMQSLKLLDKAKTLARKNHRDFSELMITELEKTIESRHITRSGADRSHELVGNAASLNKSIYNRVKLSNIRTLLHGLYIQKGHVRDRDEHMEVEQTYYHQLVSVDHDLLGRMEKVHLYQSFVWYYYILQDFGQCEMYAKKWVDLFDDSPDQIFEDVDLYMRGYHYLLTTQFYQHKVSEYMTLLDRFESFRKSAYPKLNANSQIISFLYVHYGRLSKFFLTGDFLEGLNSIPSTLNRIRRYKAKLDEHRILVFYYKIAWMYLGAEEPAQAIEYLNRITALNAHSLRQDIQGYSRIMLLMAHYDLGNYDIIDYLIRTFQVFFRQMSESNEVQLLSMQMFTDLAKAPLGERVNVLQKYVNPFFELAQNPYEKRAFLYLDIPAWIQARTRKITLSQAIGYRIHSSD